MRPVEERGEARLELGGFGSERDDVVGRGFDRTKRLGEIAFSAPQSLLPFCPQCDPGRIGEAFEDGRRNVPLGERPLVIDADDPRHVLSVELAGALLSSGAMDSERARYLLSSRGQERLATTDNLGRDPLALQRALRKELPPAEAAAVGEQVVLRARARERFGPGFADWLWTAETLEMAAHPGAADRRARRLAQVAGSVIDGTTGAGVDLAACAAFGLRATGFERDEVRALLASHNLHGSAPVVRADVRCPPADLGKHALLLDPSRRGPEGRRFDPAWFEPSWETCLTLARSAPVAVVKAPPGIDRSAIPPDAEADWLQAGRSLREAALWFGRGAAPGLRRAVILDAGGGAALDSLAEAAPWQPRPLGSVVYDPEPAVTRAGLAAQLAAAVAAWPLDHDVAYLSGEEFRPTPFARAFAVLDVLDFSLDRLRRRIRARGWRLGEVLRRRFPVEPESLRRLCGRLEGEPVTGICTTVAGRRLVIFGQPLPTDRQPGRQ